MQMMILLAEGLLVFSDKETRVSRVALRKEREREREGLAVFIGAGSCGKGRE